MTRLTLRRLNAIEEALSARLAGERDCYDDPDTPTDADYEAAYDWVTEQIERREKRAPLSREGNDKDYGNG